MLPISPLRSSRHSDRPPVRPPRCHRDVTYQAQEIACSYLVQAAERALLDLRTATGHAVSSGQARTNLRAVEMLEDVLTGWRETLEALRITHQEVG